LDSGAEANLLVYSVFGGCGIAEWARNKQGSAMNAREWRAAGGLATIFGLRMLGLFLILPVFAVYGDRLDGATPLLIGVAIGAYGLTQALLQIPLGTLSDPGGRL